MENALNIGSLDDLIRWGGYLVLFAIIFSETGLFFGFLLPGDSLIITAGLACANGTLDFATTLFVMTTAAILGDSTGYFIGKSLGTALFQKEDSAFFKREYLRRTDEFYKKHGGKTVFFARFVPIVRSFATTVAGVAQMPYSTFILFSVSGAATWILSLAGLGYFLGSQFPEMEKYINLVIAVSVALIVLSTIVRLAKARFFEQKSP